MKPDSTQLSRFAKQACLWEATARKVGNVHPKRGFADCTYEHFVRSADCFDGLDFSGDQFGSTLLKCVRFTKQHVGVNTNLGILLLLAPLLHAKEMTNECLEDLINRQDEDSTEMIYEAIRVANPGGLGKVATNDVRAKMTIGLRTAMAQAAPFDLIAAEYVNGFSMTRYDALHGVQRAYFHYHCVELAVIHAHLLLMANHPDSLIVRKNGDEIGWNVQDGAARVFNAGGPALPEGRKLGVAFDTYLRSDGNKLNPGTSADLVCAGIFVALLTGAIPLDAPFDWPVEDWL
jgi:triphosphoribosyl-dephospho-CoA synthase